MACRARDAFLGILCKVFPFIVFPCVWGEGDQSAMLGCVAAWPALFKQRGPAWTRVDNGEGQTSGLLNVYAGEVFLKVAGRQSEKVAMRSVPFQLGEPAHEADYRDIVFYFYVFFFH